MIVRRHVRRALAEARAAHAAGDFAAARRIIQPVVAARGAPLEAVRGMAELEYLLGDYDAAEALLDRIVKASRKRSEARLDAEAALALVYYRTNRYDKAHGLFAGSEDDVEMPIWKLMTAFGGDPPYAIEWPAGEPRRPCRSSRRRRGSCRPSRSRSTASRSTRGSTPAATRSRCRRRRRLARRRAARALRRHLRRWRAGRRATTARSRRSRLGPVTLRNVPVATAGFDRPVIGTGFLSRFLATIDYPQGACSCARTGARRRPRRAVEVPFALALTHLMVVSGSLADRAGLTFLVDSGLRDERGAAFTAPAATLAAAGIPLPDTSPESGMSGAGDTTLELGRFGISRLALGPLVQHDLVGMYGAFPDELSGAATGFPIHGLVSHHFLRRYRWTIDFAG